jgi:exodeoxyribonuclease-5
VAAKTLRFSGLIFRPRNGVAEPAKLYSTMSDITLTDNQARAVSDIKDWFKNRTKEQQVYRVFGYAGTGKTTITKYAIQELGLDMDGTSPNVRFAAYTGKAAYVMRKHGTPARTICSLFYSLHEPTEQEIEDAKNKLHELESNVGSLYGLDKIAAEAQIAAMRLELKNMRKPRFGLNPDSEVRDCSLIVLDEVSMVGWEQAADILSFEKPVLVLGDPGQLPPIRGEGAFTQARPDIMLTEIHRQAEESAIIRLATMARNGEAIPYGMHDPAVWKMSRRDLGPENFLKADQVICGKNAMRLELNNAMRAAAGFDRSIPYPADGEKIICLKNQNSLGLINGMFLDITGARPYKMGNGQESRISFRAKIKDEEGNPIGYSKKGGEQQELDIYLGHFLDHQIFDKERADRDWKDKKSLIEATFGWAITCHKAQGSQWRNVMVWDDHLGRTTEERARLLYTAITRAMEGLIILD